MHVILLSDSFGQGLWPLSNDLRLGQYIKLLRSPEGNRESVIQRLCRQLKSAGTIDSITIVAGLEQRDQLETQIGKNVQIIYKDEIKGVLASAVIACSRLLDRQIIDRDQTLILMPANILLDNGFMDRLHEMEYELNRMGENGLILMNRQCGDEDILSNNTIVCLKAGIIADIGQQSFDKAIIDRIENVKWIRCSGFAKEVRTWDSYVEEIDEKISNSTVTQESCSNTHIINEQGIPIMVLGIDNAVIVASHDGILIANKQETIKLRNQNYDLKRRPMFEERRWGHYAVLTSSRDHERECVTKKLRINQGSQISYQYHRFRKEIWTIVSGAGLLYLEGEKREVYPGDVVTIEIGMKHALRALETLELIEVQLGTNLVEDDIVRLDYDWN